jgi:hypothetical protein
MKNSEQLPNAESEIIPREALLQSAVDAFVKITGRKGDVNAFYDNLYLTARYTDKERRHVEFRVYELPEHNGKLMLYANLGNKEALKELKQKFEDEGVAIERLGGN